MKLEDLKENMYVRNTFGRIAKIEYIEDDTAFCDNWLWQSYEEHIDFINLKDKEDVEDIIKASFNVIDILEVGDVLYLLDKEYGEKYKAEVVLDDNNVKSIVNYEQCDLLNLEYELITEEHIKVLQILTKEQFEQMSYKLGE